MVGGALAVLAAAAVQAQPAAAHPQSRADACGSTRVLQDITYSADGSVREVDGRLMRRVPQGVRLTVSFTVADGCEDVQVTLAAYRAPGPEFDRSANQSLSDATTGVFDAGRRQLSVNVPDCWFQVDLVRGLPLDRIGPPSSYYGKRLAAHAVGGVGPCAGTPPAPVVPPGSVSIPVPSPISAAPTSAGITDTPISTVPSPVSSPAASTSPSPSPTSAVPSASAVPSPESSVAPRETVAGNRPLGALPVTGRDAVQVLALGLALVAAGGWVGSAGRRRQHDRW